MPNATNKLREAFKSNPKPMTSHELKKLRPDLQTNEISMALNYLYAIKEVTREMVPNPTKMARKNVWLYTFQGSQKG